MELADAFAFGSAHKKRSGRAYTPVAGVYDLSVSRAVSGAISVAMMVMIDSPMM